MIQLYQFPLSGNSHKVRLMLSLLSLPFEAHNVSGAEREHKSPAFLAMNPFGQVPVLVDGDVVLRDSQAIVAYLSQAYGAGAWWPAEPAAMAEVVAWLATAANEVARGPNLLRMHHRFGRDIHVPAAQAVTEQLFEVMEARLASHDWLVGGAPTAADVAVYPYVALAPEARVSLAPYPALQRWLTRFQALPGYLHMPGMWIA